MEIANNDFDIAIKQLQGGSKDAFQLLFDAFGPKIYAFSLSYLKNEADAEELLQDVFLKLWEVRGSLDSSKNIKSFLFKICINLIYDFMRRKNVEQAYFNYCSQNDISANSTWHDVAYNELLENLKNLVAAMPEQRRRIFQMSKVDGLSNEEIARQLNLSQRTVENQLYRAVSFLKEKLGPASITATLFFILHCS